MSNKKCLVGSIIPVILQNFPGRSGDNHRNFNQNIQFPDRNPNWDTLQCKFIAVFPDQVPRKIEGRKHKSFSVLEYREKFQLISKCRRNVCFLQFKLTNICIHYVYNAYCVYSVYVCIYTIKCIAGFHRQIFLIVIL